MAGQNKDLEILREGIEDYLRQKGVPLRGAFSCLNPAHPDRHPSMSYNRRARNVHCFSCGATYDLFDLIGLDYGLSSFPQKVEKARELLGMAPVSPAAQGGLPAAGKDSGRGLGEPAEREEGPSARDPRPGKNGALEEGPGDSLGYFLARGLREETCRRFGFFQRDGRACLPVCQDGSCVGWCARAMEGQQPRYLNSPGPLPLWNGDYIAGERAAFRDGDPAGQGPEDLLYVTEGIFDAAVLEQLGRHALSLCGSQNTGKLLSLCRANPERAAGWRFVCCGDGDRAGQEMNQRLLEGLRSLGLRCSALAVEQGDVNQWYLRSPEGLLAALEKQEASLSREEAFPPGSAAAMLEDFFGGSGEPSQEPTPTGFSTLDQILDGGLYPGLITVGAVSSLGKTSFLLQMADQIAGQGRDVLFFTLEQGGRELLAKSLSRLSLQLAGVGMPALTARQLMRGELSRPGLSAAVGSRRKPARMGDPLDAVVEALLEEGGPSQLHGEQIRTARLKEAYQGTARHLFLREGDAGLGTEEIRAQVAAHTAQWGRPPVVVIDYLQILRPGSPRATDKQNMDRAVVELKRISRDFGTPVVAVSSFNRENYRSAVSMEAFKESGAVEYSSDVLLGLQLAGMGESGFDLNREKARDPRRVELVLLKNRNGIPYAKLRLDYFARYSLFLEASARPVHAGKR